MTFWPDFVSEHQLRSWKFVCVSFTCPWWWHIPIAVFLIQFRFNKNYFTIPMKCDTAKYGLVHIPKNNAVLGISKKCFLRLNFARSKEITWFKKIIQYKFKNDQMFFFYLQNDFIFNLSHKKKTKISSSKSHYILPIKKTAHTFTMSSKYKFRFLNISKFN